MTFRPESARVIIRPFIPADAQRVTNILGRALALTEEEAAAQTRRAPLGIRRPALRHRSRSCFDTTRKCATHLRRSGRSPESRQLLIGALFSGEYALESAALFNPSIVPHPDQSGVPEGGCVSS